MAEDLAITVELAMEHLAFQDIAMPLVRPVTAALGDSSAGSWFDWSGSIGHLCFGATTRCPQEACTHALKILGDAPIVGRARLVSVVWSYTELVAAQNRMDLALEPVAAGAPFSSGIEVERNTIKLEVPDELNAEQLAYVENAVRAAVVSVHVVPGATYAAAR